MCASLEWRSVTTVAAVSELHDVHGVKQKLCRLLVFADRAKRNCPWPVRAAHASTARTAGRYVPCATGAVRCPRRCVAAAHCRAHVTVQNSGCRNGHSGGGDESSEDESSGCGGGKGGSFGLPALSRAQLVTRVYVGVSSHTSRANGSLWIKSWVDSYFRISRSAGVRTRSGLASAASPLPALSMDQQWVQPLNDGLR